MKEIPLSIAERTSVISAIQAGLRLDGRQFLQVREMAINFGKDYGCCSVTLGHTRVLAQVTCEVVEPRPSRPNEGKVSIAVHVSPMAAPHFEAGRGNDLVDEIQQVLDRNIKESRCLDLESLCILAEESVWQLRVDVTVLNHAGNLGDACNLAAVTALRHFHRPDVTVEEDGRVNIHTLEEREPIPTFMKKIPVCLTYGFFVLENQQCITIMDPTAFEERVMSGKLVVGLNPHGEITSLLFPGKVSLQKDQIMFCIENAFSKAKASAEMIQEVVEDELEKRKFITKPDGFTGTLKSDSKYSVFKIKQRVKEIKKMDIKSDDIIEVKTEIPDTDENHEEDYYDSNIAGEEVIKQELENNQSDQSEENNQTGNDIPDKSVNSPSMDIELSNNVARNKDIVNDLDQS